MSKRPGWSLTNHCCRTCLGRIVSKDDTFMCSVCEVQSTLRVDAICGCGMRAGTNRPLPPGLTGAYKCGPNPARSIASPARIVILFGGQVADPLDESHV